MRYKAFISYSHRDEAIAKRLHRRLERFRPPPGLTLPDGAIPERLYPIFRDREEMGASHSLPETIEAALTASDHLIVLCSPASAASKWVNQEICFFADVKGAERILPVIVSGDPPDCFPKALKDALDEPLASDLRETKDGYTDGVLKIIAGLWGVSLGALKDREAARQRHRARLNTALAAVFAALVVFAGFSGWRAVEQKHRAEAEAQAAEARSLASVARITFDRNPGETSVAAMIAAQSLLLKPTSEAHSLLRDALKLAPLGATTAPFPWLWPIVETSRDGRIAAFMSVYSSDEAPAQSTIVRLSSEFDEQDRISFEGLAEPVLSADGAWMAAAGRLRRLFVQNLTTGETALDQTMKSGFAAIFSSDGVDLYATTQLGDVLRWSPGMAAASPFTSTSSGGARLTLPTLSLSTKEDALLRSETMQPSTIIALKDGTLRKVPFSPKYQKMTWKEQLPDGLVADPGGDRFIDYDSFNVGALRDIETMAPIWSFDDLSRSWTSAKANVISRDGAFYARERGDGVVVVRDMTDGAIVHRSDHSGAVLALAFLDQASRLVTAGDGGAFIWMIGKDMPTARCADGADVLSMAVEASGDLLLGTQDGRLIRCDPKTGATLIERNFEAPVTSAVIAPGQIAIALKQSDTADNWTELSFHNRKTGTSTELSLNTSFDQLKLNEDGSFAALRSWPTGEVAIRNTSTGALVNRFAARGDIIGLTPDGGRLLMDYLAQDVFDVTSGERVMQLGEAAGVSSLLATAYQDTLITGGQIDGVQEHWAWSAATGKRQWRLRSDVTLTPDGAAYAEHLRDDDRWRMIRRATGEEIGSIPFQGDQWGATLSPIGANIAVQRRVTDADSATRFETELWDVRQGKLTWKRNGGAANAPSPRVYSLSSNRAAYVYATRGEAGFLKGGIDVFDWMTGEDVFSTQWPGVGAPGFEVDLKAQNILIAAGENTTLHRLSDGKRLWSVQENYSRSMAFSPRGDFIIAARPNQSGQGLIVVLDRKTGAQVREWSFDLRAQDIVVTSDGRLAVAALKSDDWNGVRAWRINDGALAFEIEMDATPRQLMPLRDPNRLVVLDYEGSIRSFDLSQMHEVHRFPMSVRTSRHAYSADSARAATATGSRLQYWDAKSGKLLDTYLADGQLTRLTMTADGKEVAFITKRKRKARGGADTPIVQIWRPTTKEPIEVLAASQSQWIGYDPTDAVLVISSGVNERQIFDASTLAPRFAVRTLANGALATSSDASQLFTGDGEHFAVLETASYGQANTNEKRAALRAFNVATGAEVARFDVNPTTRGLTPTQNGFFYTDMLGRSRHFEIGKSPLDRVLTEGPRDKIIAIPGADLILTSGYQTGDALINIHTGAQISLTIARDAHYTLGSAVDPSGRFVALSRVRENGDAQPVNEVLVFDAKTGGLLSRTEPLPMRLSHIAFAEGGETLIASEYAENSLITNSTDDGGLYVWRWQGGQPTPLIDDNPVADFSIGSDGAWLATSEGGENRDTGEQFGRRLTRIIRLADGKTFADRSHDLYAPRLMISANGKRLGVFSAASPTSGDVIEISEGGEYETLIDVSFEDAAIFGRPLGYIENGEKLVLGERSGARVFDLETGSVRRMRVPGRAKRFALSGDGALLAIGGDTFVSIWDLISFEEVTSFDVANLQKLAFAGEDMRSLIGVTDSGVVRLEWDQKILISTACRVFQNDAWVAGKNRIAATEAPEACKR